VELETERRDRTSQLGVNVKKGWGRCNAYELSHEDDFADALRSLACRLGGTVNLIDRERNEARQMEPDVPMAMPFWQRR
jgi:hypothetical protein